MIKGIQHIALLMSSEKSLDFYKLLGFTEFFRKERKDDKVILLDGYGMQLEVFVDGRHPRKAEGLDEPLGPRHFALAVSAAIEEETERLKKVFETELDYDAGFEEIGTDWNGNRYVFFKDPDGNIVELVEYKNSDDDFVREHTRKYGVEPDLFEGA